MTTPAGFSFAGITAGLKPSGAPDLGLIVSDRPAVSAGVVTANRFQAAPIVVSKRHLRDGTARAIVANAGNANACTGRTGLDDAAAMAAAAAKALGCKSKEVLVASTGVIGRVMDMERVRSGIGLAAAALGPDIRPFARAIMTTDTTDKIATATLPGGGTILGIAKGAGMIAPEMATMLCFIATDAPVTRSVLAPALERAAGATFNTVSVDGCMSTNDCVFALANGAAGGQPIEPGTDAAVALGDALTEVCSSLAMQIVADGEGAAKTVAVRVRSAVNAGEARVAARRIADSVLLRCAIGGSDPNWGRVLAALGTAPIPFDPNVVDVWLGGEKVAERGGIGPGDLEKAALAMRERDVEIIVELNRGGAEAVVYTNDLTAEYVHINGAYTT